MDNRVAILIKASKTFKNSENDVLKMETALNATGWKTYVVDRDEINSDDVMGKICISNNERATTKSVIIYYSGHGATNAEAGAFGLQAVELCVMENYPQTDSITAIWDSCHSGGVPKPMNLSGYPNVGIVDISAGTDVVFTSDEDYFSDFTVFWVRCLAHAVVGHPKEEGTVSLDIVLKNMDSKEFLPLHWERRPVARNGNRHSAIFDVNKQSKRWAQSVLLDRFEPKDWGRRSNVIKLMCANMDYIPDSAFYKEWLRRGTKTISGGVAVGVFISAWFGWLTRGCYAAEKTDEVRPNAVRTNDDNDNSDVLDEGATGLSEQNTEDLGANCRDIPTRGSILGKQCDGPNDCKWTEVTCQGERCVECSYMANCTPETDFVPVRVPLISSGKWSTTAKVEIDLGKRASMVQSVIPKENWCSVTKEGKKWWVSREHSTTDSQSDMCNIDITYTKICKGGI